jgi:hypothetical protein
MHEEIIATAGPDDLVSSIPGDSFSATIPVSDPAVLVYEVNAVV